MWTTVSSVMGGGYIAGRMRRRVVGISADELSVRDGIHGLAVWGAAILMGAWLLGAGAGAAVDAAAQTSPTVVAAVTDAVTPQPGADVTQPADATAVIPAPTKEELETARRYSVISAFVVAASLMIAAAGAYWAAGVGGRHRDENRVFARFGTWL
ncbi:MAG: hypothetical protein L0H65_14185, partial [Pseudorhodobacter sp.]|nr:hypothetical protein [Pseudorhodobacter sp.]